MPPKVSIVVPIYNVEKHLAKCLDSIISQKLDDIEIILVNDGSTDKSGEIAEQFSEKDNRIKVIHKENGGLSSARNEGMKIASGEYLVFIDSDDWLEPDMFEVMYNAASNIQADVVISGYTIDFNNEGYSIDKIPDKTVIAKSKDQIGESVFELNKKGFFNVVWNKMYKTKFIQEINAFFILDAMPAEDLIFNVKVFKNVEKLMILNKPFYHYMKRDEETLVNKYYPRLFEISIQKHEKCKEIFNYFSLNNEKQQEWLINSFLYDLSNCIINLYRKDCQLTRSERFHFIKNNILEDIFVRENINKFSPSDIYGKLFKYFCKINSVLFMQYGYEGLFWFRYKFEPLYKNFRKIFSR
ncbi:glycosyltransferase [Pseudoneobacillus sp. C159]